MKTQFNKEEFKRDWVLNHWYEKMVWIVGVLSTTFFVIAFVAGFISGVLE